MGRHRPPLAIPYRGFAPFSLAGVSQCLPLAKCVPQLPGEVARTSFGVTSHLNLCCAVRAKCLPRFLDSGTLPPRRTPMRMSRPLEKKEQSPPSDRLAGVAFVVRSFLHTIEHSRS